MATNDDMLAVNPAVVAAVGDAITDLTGQPQMGAAYARAFVKRLAENGVQVIPMTIDMTVRRDTCPFHDLPKAQTVWVQERKHSYPISAEVGCDNWHLAQDLLAMTSPPPCRHCGVPIQADRLGDWRHLDSGVIRCEGNGTEAEPRGEDREPLICGACEELEPRRDGETTAALEERHAAICAGA